MNLQTLWNSTDSYEDRVAQVQGDLNSDPDTEFFLTVTGDGKEDQLKGDSPQDLFYAEGSLGNLVDDLDSQSNEVVIPSEPGVASLDDEGISLVDGVLTIKGTDSKDKVEIKRVGSQLEVETDFTSPKKQSFNLSSVTSIEIFLKGGQDEAKIDKEISIPTFISGGDGKDKLEAGSGDTIMLGGEGDDELKGGDGNDILDGGDGKDKLEGNKGRDILIGGTDKDELDGKEGDDILVGGTTNLNGDRFKNILTKYRTNYNSI